MKPINRNSNIEALRIISMLLILMLHVNNFSIGEPSTMEARNFPLPTLARCVFETISLISVNLFVLISGWFSIRFSLRRLATFVFQCVFIISALYLVGLCLGLAQINEIQILECLFMGRYGWFIKAYIGLMIFAPALNIFIEQASKRFVESVLCIFFTFQTLYGCVTTNTDFINAGYSTFSFVGLYLLARYAKIYGGTLIANARRITLISTIIYIMWGYLPVLSGIMRFYYMSLHYTNPANIGMALGVMLMAVNLKPTSNKFINWIGASTFAVYLCHMCNTWTATLFKKTSILIYNEFSGLIYIGVITAFMCAVFACSIVFDQLRKTVWNYITPPR